MIPAELQRMIQALGQAKMAPSVPMPIQGPEPTPAAPPQTQTPMGGLQSAASVLQTALNPTQTSASNLMQAPDQGWLNNKPYSPGALAGISSSTGHGTLVDSSSVRPSEYGPAETWYTPHVDTSIDRSAIKAELDQKPGLADRLNRMIRGEVGLNASPEVRRIQMETAMNRALVRGHSLEQALWDTAGHGKSGYYPSMSFTRGGFDPETFQGDLAAVLGGSDYGSKYGKGIITGNASADVARHQFQRRTPGFTVQTGSGPESYFSEGPFKVPLKKLQPKMKEPDLIDALGQVP